MPWEKSFDIDKATDKAIEVFWKKGYEATSMSDLIEAMNINKGSLYNAFGSKKALFHRALARYDQQKRAAQILTLRKEPSAILAIRKLFDGFIEEARSGTNTLGCFVVNTAQDLPNQPPEIAEKVRASLADIDKFFKDMIVKGRATGDIASTVDPEKTAQALMSMLVGLRVLSRGAASISALEGIRDGAVSLIQQK